MKDLGTLSQQLLQFSPDALLAVDPDGIIRFANDTAETLFGYDRGALAGLALDRLIPDRFRQRHGAHVAHYQQNPERREMGARVVDLFARRADGTEFPAGIRLAPLESGGLPMIAVAVRDMTERRAIRDALVAAREEADRANRAQSRFLATASHDLRQPLHAVRLLNASLVRLAPQGSDVHDLLLRQELAIEGVTRLLNSLLDISRLESGAIDPQIGPVNLGQVFADLQREFEPSAAAKNLELRFAETQAVLLTDRILFLQLLQNLIGNALKYTDRGYVRVAVSTDSDSVLIKVEDSGIGIPEDKLDRIFDEYYQVDPRGTPRLGVGLGLAIVREVSRLLGYLVAVSSRPGEGTRVRVRIPRQHLVSEVQRAAVVPEAQPGQTPAVRGRVLLVEDNPSVRTATEMYLGLEGIRTVSAGSAAEVENIIGDPQPGDVLVTDYRLDGGQTGLDILNRIRSMQGRCLPAVLLSGDLESMMRAIKTPVPSCRFLSKPVDTQALLQAIVDLSAA